MTERRTLQFAVHDAAGGIRPVSLEVSELLVAGYTGRDRQRVLEHVRELAALGVPEPEQVPAVYPLSTRLLTTGGRVAVSGRRTSGEAEFIVVPAAEGLLVGVGSDHTDRELERENVARSKAVCPKPIGADLWRYGDVAAHWDALELRAWATDGAGRRLYQSGSVAALLPVERLLEETLSEKARRRAGGSGDGVALIFGGTLPLLEGFVMGDEFEAELHDPVLGRTLRCAYVVEVTESRLGLRPGRDG